MQGKFTYNSERFSLYEKGELNEAAKKELETELLLNSDLRIEYRVYREVNEFLKKLQDRREIKNKTSDS